ncbi:MAG: hypothetical protein KKE62_10505 [Proteobacteria bacterium]|nr:hypothetical protein [Pseudomonadota bacterium]MBU1543257.1 hypothetical protein [Pseudomonadota bacterium]
MKLFFKLPNILFLYEISGFGIIILFLWLDAIFDIPAHLFGGMQTPVNIPESIFETIFILIVGVLCIWVTHGLLTKIKVLEGRLPICASCKKIRDHKGVWQHLEKYIESRSNATFSHGVCPDCMEKLYGHQAWYRQSKLAKKQGENL